MRLKCNFHNANQETSCVMNDKMKGFLSEFLHFIAESVLSLPLAFAIMVAGLVLFMPSALYEQHFTWSQVIAAEKASPAPLSAMLFSAFTIIRWYFFAAWPVALLARMIHNGFFRTAKRPI